MTMEKYLRSERLELNAVYVKRTSIPQLMLLQSCGILAPRYFENMKSCLVLLVLDRTVSSDEYAKLNCLAA